MAAKAAGDQPERLAPVPSTVSLPDSSTSSSSPSSISTSPNGVSTVSTGSSQQSNDQTKTSVPPTVSLPANSTRSDSPLSTTSVSAGGGQESNSQTEKSSPNVGAIVGGAIGGLAFLVVVGVGVWIFRRQRASGEEIGRDHPDNLGHSSDVVTHENDMQPPEMRLYVRFFVLLPNLFPDLRQYRIRLTHSPSRIKFTTE